MAKGEYNYEEDGPDSWFLHYDQCAGSMQSPINIQSASASYSSSLKPFTFNNYSEKPYLEIKAFLEKEYTCKMTL